MGFSASSEKMAGKEAIWFLQQQVDQARHSTAGRRVVANTSAVVGIPADTSGYKQQRTGKSVAMERTEL